MTVRTVASNNVLSELINMYNDGTYTPDKDKQLMSDWAMTLTKLADSMLSFINDSARLEAYINGQR